MLISKTKKDLVVVQSLLDGFSKDSKKSVFSEIEDTVCVTMSRMLKDSNVYSVSKEKEKAERAVDQAVTSVRFVLIKALKNYKRLLSKKK